MSTPPSRLWRNALLWSLAAVTIAGSVSAQAAAKITTITGKISDTNKVAIAGAIVQAHSTQAGANRQTTTNANGEFTIVFNDTSTAFVLTATAPRYRYQTLDLLRQPDDDRIVVNLRLRATNGSVDTAGVNAPKERFNRLGLPTEPRPAPMNAARNFGILGTIADQGDRPVAGARVVASPGPGSVVTPNASGFEEAWIWTATTDDKGRFALELPAALTNFTLSVSAIGFARVNQAFTSHGPGDMVYNVKLGNAAIIISAPYPRTIVSRQEAGPANAADFWSGEGDITVTGTDEDFITYQVIAQPGTRAVSHPEDVGLHIVNGLGIRTLGGPGSHLVITVPRSLKALKLTIGHSGAVHVDHFDGELTVTSEQGAIELTDVSGPTLVEARDGGVQVAFSKLPAMGAHGLSVLGRNGDVTVTLPSDVKASLSLEVHRGTASSAFNDGPSKIVVDASDLEASRRLAPQGTPPTASEIPQKYIRDVNGGGVQVSVIALNGNIIVKKRTP